MNALKFASKAAGGSTYVKAGTPALLTSGNYGCFLPKKMFGVTTHGRKGIIDLKTTSLTEALNRVEAIGIFYQLGSPNVVMF